MGQPNNDQVQRKKSITKKMPNLPGIRTLWDWSATQKKYVLRQRGNIYYCSKKVCGKQYSKCFPSLDEAKKWWINPLTASFTAAANESSMRFTELKELFLAHYKARVRISTFETFTSKIRHLDFFDGFAVKDITPRVVDTWLASVKKPDYLQMQQATRVTYAAELSALSQLLNYFKEYICEHESYALPLKKRHRTDCIVHREKYLLAVENNGKRYLLEQDFLRFLAFMRNAATENKKYKVFYLMALAQLRTGARIGEICALRWEDINLESSTATIQQSVQWKRRKDRPTTISPLTKTNKSRQIPIMSDLLSELKAWRLELGRSTGLVFSLQPTQPIEYRSIQNRYDVALKAIGVDWRATHILRHSFATDVLAKTGDLSLVQGMLGHKTQEQTLAYAKITDEVLRNGMQKYEGNFHAKAR